MFCLSSTRPSLVQIVLLSAVLVLADISVVAYKAQNNPAPRTPSDTVREFYRSMRERRFRDAFLLTNYKTAIEDLTTDEMEYLRPGFEEKAGQIPVAVEITGEQISGNSATVFVKIPVNASTPQTTSEPVNLINSGGAWIIVFGTEADQAAVKKAGRRFFLDALITEHEGDVEDLLKRLVVLEGIYSQQHNGAYGDFPALIAAGMLSNDAIDPKLSGYNFHITVAKNGKTYIASAEPTQHGRTGKLSFWMDQTGLIKSADNGGKSLKP